MQGIRVIKEQFFNSHSLRIVFYGIFIYIYLFFIPGVIYEKFFTTESKTEQYFQAKRTINCSEIKFAKPRTFLPQTILYSYPGSGNTWLRHLIEITTGFYSGSIYADQRLFRLGMLGEGKSPNTGETIVTKSHSLKVKLVGTRDTI